jgi:hypothetical protein
LRSVAVNSSSSNYFRDIFLGEPTKTERADKNVLVTVVPSERVTADQQRCSYTSKSPVTDILFQRLLHQAYTLRGCATPVVFLLNAYLCRLRLCYNAPRAS